jgi:hypothetical protein
MTDEVRDIYEDFVPPEGKAVVRVVKESTDEVRDIHEDFAPPEGKAVVRVVEEPTVQLRRWTVVGLGVLTGLVLMISIVVVLIRPELAEFVRNFLGVVFAGLFGLGGTVVGFLFGREELP